MISVMIIFGILLVIIAIFLIILNRKEEIIRYNKSVKIHNDIIQYSDIINDILLDIEGLIEKSSLENRNVERCTTKAFKEVNNQMDKTLNPNFTNVKDKVIELYKNGNSIDGIAKTLNKGKREVEMIVKLNKLNKK